MPKAVKRLLLEVQYTYPTNSIVLQSVWCRMLRLQGWTHVASHPRGPTPYLSILPQSIGDLRYYSVGCYLGKPVFDQPVVDNGITFILIIRGSVIIKTQMGPVVGGLTTHLITVFYLRTPDNPVHQSCSASRNETHETIRCSSGELILQITFLIHTWLLNRFSMFIILSRPMSPLVIYKPGHC